MAGLLKAIKEEALAKHIPIQDNRFNKVNDILDNLFLLGPVEDLELEFEKQVFTRGTGGERVGLHTSSIIASDKVYCRREQVLSLLYKPRDTNHQLPISTLRIFEEGNSIHRKWQRLFLRGGLCKVEDLDRTCYDVQHRLSYSPDAFITIKGRKFVVEIKSMNMFAYKNAAGKHPSGEIQCLMYMWLSDTKHGIILMENKNTQDYTIKILNLNENLYRISDYIARLEEVNGLYEEKKMPGRRDDCKSELSKRCLACPQNIACWGTKEERRELLLAV